MKQIIILVVLLTITYNEPNKPTYTAAGGNVVGIDYNPTIAGINATIKVTECYDFIMHAQKSKLVAYKKCGESLIIIDSSYFFRYTDSLKMSSYPKFNL